MRLKPEARKEDLLAVALVLAESGHYTNVTRGEVAKAAHVSGPVLNYHFGTMAQFRRDLMRYAIRMESIKVLAQGLSIQDPQAVRAPSELKRRALDALL